MNILSQIRELRNLPGPLHLAIGVFDGVHLGHQKVIQTALKGAENSGGTAVVVTFDPHPIRVLRPDKAPRLLASLGHKTRVLLSIGVRNLLIQAFDENFAELTAESFVTQLVEAGQPLKQICVGRDWRFGHQRKGDHHLLKAMGQEHGFTLDAIDPVTCPTGEVVSSTRIRKAIRTGNFDNARILLGRDYSVLGTVVKGRQLGRTIGFPTANLRVFNEELPPSGVYAVKAQRNDGTNMPGVANLGLRPTVEDEAPRRQLEVHLFDFKDDIYGEELEIHFSKFIRPEQKFENLDALKAQIARDVEAVKSI